MIRFDWARPRDARTDLRRPATGSAQPLRERLEHVAATTGSLPPRYVEGAAAALRASLHASADVPQRMIVSGAEPPDLVAALAAIRGEALSVALVPPEANGGPCRNSLRSALEAARRDGALPTVVVGAVTALGALAPLEHVARMCRDESARFVVDLTLAPFAFLDELPLARPDGAIAALDRWDGEPKGHWGFVRLDPTCELPPPPEPSTRIFESVHQLDTWLRAALSRRDEIRVLPASGVPKAAGLIALAIDGLDAREAGALLADGYGARVEADALTAVPIPASGAAERGSTPLRVTLAAETSEREVEALVEGIWSIVERRGAVRMVH
jgi:selenocysteine lyase/cysteine desulfurase